MYYFAKFRCVTAAPEDMHNNFKIGIKLKRFWNFNSSTEMTISNQYKVVGDCPVNSRPQSIWRVIIQSIHDLNQCRLVVAWSFKSMQVNERGRDIRKPSVGKISSELYTFRQTWASDCNGNRSTSV